LKIVNKAKKLVVLTLIGALGLSNSAMALTGYPGLSSNYQKSSSLSKLQNGLLGTKEGTQYQKSQVKDPEYIKGELLVKFKSGFSQHSKVFSNLGLSVIEKNQLGYYRLKVKNSENFKEILNKLEQNPAVDAAQPNYIFSISGANETKVNDTRFSNQWGINSINATKAWKITKGSPKIVLAIVDSGVDVTHPEFKDRIVKGYNSENPLYSPRDDMGHGTHVAGIAAAAANNNMGIVGVAPNIKIMPVKVINNYGWGNDFNIAEGIKWAADHGANIINLSLGSYWYSQILDDAVQYAHKKGAVIVTAAGNDYGEVYNYPAALSNVLTVTASNKKNELAKFSSYSDTTDVSAPGEEIYSSFWNAKKGSTYAYQSGTSMASPHVAGLAALILSVNPKLKPLEVHQIIETSTKDLGERGWDKKFGYGLIDVEKAVAKAKSFSSVKDGNDKLEEAIQAQSGIEIVGELNTAIDEDWFTISLENKGALDIKGVVTKIQDLVIDIYNEQKTKVATINYGSKGVSEKSTLYNLEPGKYYLKVTEASNHWSNDDYKLMINTIAEDKILVDKNEPNDDEENAKEIMLTSDLQGEIKGVFDKAKDKDLYKIKLKKGQKVKFKLTAVEGIDSLIKARISVPPLEESMGKEMYYGGYEEGYNMYFNSNPAGQGEEGIINAMADGEVLIDLSDIKENATNEEYTLSFEKFTPNYAADTFEPNNTPDLATTLELGKKLEGANFGQSADSKPDRYGRGDMDWYVLEVKDKGQINVKVDIAEKMPVNIVVYDEEVLTKGENRTQPIGYIWSGYESKEVKGSFKASPGKYYLRAEGYDMLEQVVQTYNISTEWAMGDFDQYEINDNFQKATPITLNTTIKGNLYPEGDIDYYAVSLPANKNFQVELVPPDGQDTRIEVLREMKYDNMPKELDGMEIWPDFVTQIDNGKEGQPDAGVFRTIDMSSLYGPVNPEEEPEDTMYYFGIVDKNYYMTGTGNASKIPYTLKISEYKATKDKWENNDNIKVAKAIKLNGEIKPTFMEADDVDWFKVTIPKAGSLDITLGTPGDLDGVIEIYNEKGKKISRRDEVFIGDSEILKINVQPGTYYLKAYEGIGNGSLVSYSLKTKFVVNK
jgi:subtilisin family serine protease